MANTTITENRVVPFYACEHGTPGGCAFCNADEGYPGIAHDYEQMRGALKAIAEMKVDETTNGSQLAALCIAIARTALPA